VAASQPANWTGHIAFVKTRTDLVDPDIMFQFCAFGFDYTPDGWKMLERPAVML
jgi:hypothetical protein